MCSHVSRRTDIAKSAGGPKLQGLLAENALVDSYLAQGFVLGGAEGGVEEVGQDECQGVEINVEDVEEENSKDDGMVGR